MTSEKKQIRTYMKNRLEALSADADEWASFSYAACMRALTHPAFMQANTLLLYAAMKDEPDASAIIEAAQRANKRIAFPVCGENRSMRAYAPLHPDAWEVGKYGIRTPRVEESLPIAPGDIELVLVPGLAFDRRGARLGRGAGYYDRYLEKTHAYRLGICLDFQLIDRLPLEEHDALMQAVATNTELAVL